MGYIDWLASEQNVFGNLLFGLVLSSKKILQSEHSKSSQMVNTAVQ